MPRHVIQPSLVSGKPRSVRVPVFNGKHFNAASPRGNEMDTAIGFQFGERGPKANIIRSTGR